MIKQISCISNREGLRDEKHFNINHGASQGECDESMKVKES